MKNVLPAHAKSELAHGSAAPHSKKHHQWVAQMPVSPCHTLGTWSDDRLRWTDSQEQARDKLGPNMIN